MKHPMVYLVLLVIAWGHVPLQGKSKKAGAPNILSVHPLGGLPGAEVQVKILGKNLRDAGQILFDCDELQGEVQRASAAEPAGEEDEVTVAIRIGKNARAGIHILRLSSSEGVSGPLAFNVNGEPTVEETAEAHNTPGTAQAVKVPSIINGTLARPGELDLYTLDVQQGQELHVELLNGSALFEEGGGPFRRPELVLYQPGPSWFGTDRHKRLEGIDESTCFAFPRGSVSFYCRARWVYRFTGSGSYTLQVGANSAQGGPDFSYQLRLLRAEQGSKKREWWDYAFAHASPSLWREWDFEAPLEADRLHKLVARSVPEKPIPTEPLRVVEEQTPNDSRDDALTVQLPVVLEGRIETPGDRDYFRFSAKSGTKLAFELENPGKAPHYFDAKITILNSEGEELRANIYRRVGGDGDDWLKSIARKTLFAVPKDGDYWVEVRDITNQRGDERSVYRILLRPAIPHIGSVKARTMGLHGTEPELDRVNIASGEVQRLDVISDLEEGFDGEVTISVENLPAGVRAFSGAAPAEELASEPGRVDETRGAVDKEMYLPSRVRTTILLVASADAPPTPVPQLVRLVARPVERGAIGEPFPAQEWAFMVTGTANQVAPEEEATVSGSGKKP